MASGNLDQSRLLVVFPCPYDPNFGILFLVSLDLFSVWPSTTISRNNSLFLSPPPPASQNGMVLNYFHWFLGYCGIGQSVLSGCWHGPWCGLTVSTIATGLEVHGPVRNVLILLILHSACVWNSIGTKEKMEQRAQLSSMKQIQIFTSNHQDQGWVIFCAASKGPDVNCAWSTCQ